MNTNGLLGYGFYLLGALALLFILLFLGGLTSAALEVRRERRAGLPVTRPAWDNRVKRRAAGGWRASVRNVRERFANRGLHVCWCGRGPLAEFPADRADPAGWGCCAYEAGEPEAFRRHEEAGGYSRTPILRPGAAA